MTPELAELLELDYGGFADDLPFYEQLTRHCGGPALELGAGAGRVALHVARAGVEVWGIDTSEALLERARANDTAEDLRLVAADMRSFDLGRRFDLVYAAFGTLHHLLTRDELLGCFGCVQRHLTSGGLFAFDLRPVAFADWEEGTSAPLWHDWTRALPGTGETVVKLRAVRPDLERRLQRETHIYDRVAPDGTVRRTVHDVDLRFSTLGEIEALLREAGLVIDRTYGDFELAPYHEEDSEYLIAVARAAGDAS